MESRELAGEIEMSLREELGMVKKGEGIGD